MDGIRQYLLTIIVGAMICAITSKLCEKTSANSAIIKLLCEIFLLIILVSPLVKIRLSDLYIMFDDNAVITDAVAVGESYASEQTDELIKQSMTAYILDKASLMGADIQVNVSLSETSPKIPVGVVISGDVSPYIKTVLKNAITNDLGVPEESQIWN